VLTIAVIGLVIIAVIATVFYCATKSDTRHVSLEADWKSVKVAIDRETQRTQSRPRRRKLPPRGNAKGS
jgi:hypothetical protein